MKTCELCDHSLKMMLFIGETKRRLTCPDCGWRPIAKAAIPSRDFQLIYDVCHAAGMGAVAKLQVTPMCVVQRANPLDDRSQIIQAWTVPDGPCGFAWVVIRPANCAFAKWLVKNGHAKPHYAGGVSIWIGWFNQSIQRKEAYAQAFAHALTTYGIRAYAGSRMD